MNVRAAPLILITLTLGLLAGCANSSLTGDTHSREDARKVQQVEFGNVVSVKSIVIEGDREGAVGNIGGTVIGGIVGSGLGDGQGQGQSIASVIGGRWYCRIKQQRKTDAQAGARDPNSDR